MQETTVRIPEMTDFESPLFHDLSGSPELILKNNMVSKKQLVNSLGEAYSAISEKYGNHLPSQLLLITGPSRTANIEKTLTLGAHGPKGLHVFLY
ncbi:LUD domain-containing protein [Tangfeifania diversioriginum]|uniref:LUD domain-containing protein n=1 Tax=Tangfeifania diversioriginum TaxID=1168035 RepID=UPI001C3199A8|nr:LUD domain-containing protein [Tangfeifania diversioriginum]